MKLTDAKYEKLTDISKGRFGIVYEETFITHSDKDNVIDVIKEFNSCYNSYIAFIVDNLTGEFFNSHVNKKKNARGQTTQYYTNFKTKEVVYNEEEAMKPIVIIQPVEFTKDAGHGYIDTKGNFYRCDFEAHYYFAKELFFSKTIEQKKEEVFDSISDYSTALNDRGWVKISSYRISHELSRNFTSLGRNSCRNLMTKEQQEAVWKFMEVTEKHSYEFQGISMKVAEIMVAISE